jgi:hypothetical protein
MPGHGEAQRTNAENDMESPLVTQGAFSPLLTILSRGAE